MNKHTRHYQEIRDGFVLRDNKDVKDDDVDEDNSTDEDDDTDEDSSSSSALNTVILPTLLNRR